MCNHLKRGIELHELNGMRAWVWHRSCRAISGYLYLGRGHVHHESAAVPTTKSV